MYKILQDVATVQTQLEVWGMTLETAFLASWFHLLHAKTNKQQLTIGTRFRTEVQRAQCILDAAIDQRLWYESLDCPAAWYEAEIN